MSAVYFFVTALIFFALFLNSAGIFFTALGRGKKLEASILFFICLVWASLSGAGFYLFINSTT